MYTPSPTRRAARLIALLPLGAGLGSSLIGAMNPLWLPALAGLAVGFAARGPRPAELAALALFTGVVLAPSVGLALMASLALLALGLRGGPRWRAVGLAVVAIGAAAVLYLDADGPMTALRQLRLLAGAAGLGLAAIAVVGGHSSPLARRVAGLIVVALLLGLLGPAAAQWPDAWRLTSPYLAWAAPGITAIGAAWALRGGSMAVVAVLWPVGPALLGAITGTSPGLEAAAWLLLGPAFAIAAADDAGHLPGPLTALALGGLPGALPAVAAWIGGTTALTAVHPAPLEWPAWLAAGGGLVVLIAVARRIIGQRSHRLDLALAGGLIALGALYASGWRPTASAGDAAAAQLERRRLPPDDTRGWRRLWRLEHPPSPPSAPDAGVSR